MTIQEITISGIQGTDFEVRLFFNREPLVRSCAVMHAHPALEISVPGDCSGIYNINGAEFAFEPGDVFIFRSNEAHCITEINADKEPICLGVHFYPTVLQSVNDNTNIGRFLWFFSANNTGFRNKITPESEHHKNVALLIQNLQEEFENREFGFELRIKLIILEILLEFVRSDRENRIGSIPMAPVQLETINRVISFVNQHYAETLTLQGISEAVNISPSYLSHIFPSITGFTIWNYIMSKRIGAAQKLLLESDANVLDIALSCGFNNSTHFNKCFRKFTGTTPKAFRSTSVE